MENRDTPQVRICPICKAKYTEHPALSRADNETLICPNCGMLEALYEKANAANKGWQQDNSK
jgi:hydrogenase maturation factor HypF (carbamoyltransferase family)